MPIVTGTVKDEAEALYIGAVEFENQDAPHSGGAFIVGPALTIIQTDSSGAIPTGIRLAPGRTRMRINGRWSKSFTLPEGNGTYDLSTLMATAAALRTRVIVEADDLDELREAPSMATNYIAHVIADDNGIYSVFKWSAAATDADDGGNYIRPDDFVTAGLWVRIL
jgi:hypothetical protein